MATFAVNTAQINRMLRSPSGPAGRDLRRRARRVTNRAKTLCPVGFTGRLRSSIHESDVRREPTGLVISVGTNVVYAAAIHEGRGSRFAPRSWRRRGPGPRRFLRNALPAGR